MRCLSLSEVPLTRLAYGRCTGSVLGHGGRDDGTGLVVDVRPDERTGERDAVKFAGIRDACAPVGRGYGRVG
ncbi:hypothetical protein GCM10010269_06700 [Streptomyces humidus]|uniref:Uncharacterized protein n=1 Tax=Streptomyces humidus TaxID=52259 RepID=A0A918FRC5_9ACTN|nr:hypothetical protein GCM10010269_06700 [Streptomyces humidus]